MSAQPTARRRFAIPIERYGNAGAAAELRKLVGPFLLRRLKTDPAVAADLPAKIEAKVFCPLTAEQATLYQAVVDDALAGIDAGGDGDVGGGGGGDEMARRGKILAVLLRLKQVCDHPALFLADGSTLSDRSGKLDRLIEMLEVVLASGERALVFTQFATMDKLLCRHRGVRTRLQGTGRATGEACLGQAHAAGAAGSSWRRSGCRPVRWQEPQSMGNRGARGSHARLND